MFRTIAEARGEGLNIVKHVKPLPSPSPQLSVTDHPKEVLM